MTKIAKEIDNINAGLRKIGCEDTEIGGRIYNTSHDLLHVILLVEYNYHFS